MKGETGPKKYLILFVILCVPTIACILLGYYWNKKAGGHFAHLPNVTYTDVNGETQNRRVPDFRLVNQNGDTISQKDLEGKIYLADFFFTKCPTICPIMTANLMKLQNRFAQFDEFMIVSFSVDPVRDTPSVLKEYAEVRDISSSNWYFLTGPKDSIYTVAYHYLAAAQEDSLASGGFLHTENFVLVDKDGNLRSRLDKEGNVMAVYDGTNARHVKNLKKDIETLIAEYKLELKKYNKNEENE
jgi:protein SCO1/2